MTNHPTNPRIAWLRDEIARNPGNGLDALARLAALDDLDRTPNPVVIERLCAIVRDSIRAGLGLTPSSSVVAPSCCSATASQCAAKQDIGRGSCCPDCRGHE